ncbi:hypothetical protein Desor_2404 [Desulfosporosinus orientis DSM 765]|uniref:Uncharacterized protein n=1 Tax=Desulfosporosinus orientis (strain ATCC 19365 / DSM 765 / NCIMB 8382 / VKM B-1628 / Singapore I) TaxID=768706 RepID=G7WF96_DESOD|nr:hypothetical protein Desor_2404 [Desulfosporosinus orientis DSM 765]
MALPLEILIVPESLIGKYTLEIEGICDFCNKTEN